MDKPSPSRSHVLYERAKKLMPGGVNSPVRAFAPYPFFTHHAKGSKIVDVDDNEYIDYCLAYGPLILGHSHPEVIGAVKEQLEKGTMYGTPSEGELELAELVCNGFPSAEMIRLVNTGTEATMSAIRAARGYTGRKKIVKFEGCYHGAHDCVLVKTGSGGATFGVPNSLGVPEETVENTIMLPFNDVKALQEALNREGRNIAAVIMEPVIGNMGVVLPNEGYLEQVRKLTEENDVVLIFDEIITGFRLSFGGAQEYFGVIPDMVTLGKIMGGGFPIAAFGGQKDIMEMISPVGKVYQAGTFSGNPISVAAGLAALKAIKKRGRPFYNELKLKCNRVATALREISEDCHVSVVVNNIASMFQVFFTENHVYDYESAKKADKEKFLRLQNRLLAHEVFVPPSQFETCFVSTQHSDEDIEATIEAFKVAFKFIK